MKLKETSWHAELYMNTYGVESYKLPDDGCKYIKKVMLGILLYPLNIIAWPSNIMFRNDPEEEHHSLAERTFMGFLMFAAAWCAFCILSFLTVIIWQPVDWENWYDFWKQTNAAGAALLALGALIGGYHGLKKLYKNWKDNRTEVESSPNIFKEFYTAKKNKYCPHIDWEIIEDDED